jgi:DNA-binding CsgD family transcriptional regulator
VKARALVDLLATAKREPFCLLIEGEAGIGKTTAWLDAIEAARAQGFLVFSCRPASTESAIAYACLADLLNVVEPSSLTLYRPWMLVVALRGRAMLLGARGELRDASAAAKQAIVEGNRVAMPFEHARTQLLLGQVQRRLRERGSAVATLTDALHTFESLKTPLWAVRARRELANVDIRPHQGLLTMAERRVAELAAQGLTKSRIAAALFVSRKTVDTHLTKVYRKLDIHTRAELARLMAQAAPEDA